MNSEKLAELETVAIETLEELMGRYPSDRETLRHLEPLARDAAQGLLEAVKQIRELQARPAVVVADHIETLNL